MFPILSKYPYVVLDTETTGLKWWIDKIFGISISLPDGQDFYWDIRTDDRIVPFLREEIPKCKKIICHNTKFDMHFCRGLGIHFPEDRIDCTVIRAALIDEHMLTYDLDHVGNKCVGIGKDNSIWVELAQLFGGKPTSHAQAQNLQRAPASLVGRYAKQDARTTRLLYEWQEAEIDKQELRSVHGLELELLPVLVEMEYGGVPVDVNQAEHASITIGKLIEKMQWELNKLAGFPVNPNPSNSIKQLFNPTKNVHGEWELCDGSIAPSTPAGAPSLDADVLRSMKHPAADMILKVRKMIRTKDVFLDGHILGHHHNGIVHCNYNQTRSDNELGTGTGRLSVNSPALQQIHKRDEEIAEIVRSVFLPDSGCDWVCNDWEQMDFRMFAHYLNDPRIVQVYLKDPAMDFHQLASDITGLPRKPRYAGDANAKQINLGLIFGMGQGKLASEMGLPFTVERKYQGDDCESCAAHTCTKSSHIKTWLKPGPEAISVFERYHNAIPGVQDLLKNVSSVARSRGYVKTILDRHIRFPRGQFTHKAGGLIFQGSAADALKIKLIAVHKYLKSTESGSRLLLNVHDEFDSSIPKDRIDIRQEISRIVTVFDGVECPIKFRIPIRTQQGVGPNWWISSK